MSQCVVEMAALLDRTCFLRAMGVFQPSNSTTSCMIKVDVLLISFLLIFCLPGASQEPTFLEPVEFNYRYNSEVYAIIIDAGTKREYRRRRIPGAIGIPGMDELKAFADTMDTETPLYIYCDGESRSSTAAGYLEKRGFGKLYIDRKSTRLNSSHYS